MSSSGDTEDIREAVDDLVNDDNDDDRERTANIPNVLDSSDNSDEETLSSSFQAQDRTFQNILAVLVGGYQQETTSDSDSDAEGQSWLYQPQPAPPQPQPPDITEMKNAEITIHTNQSLGVGSRRGRLSLPGMTADRSLRGQFSVRDKRLICSNLLPHNSKKVGIAGYASEYEEEENSF